MTLIGLDVSISKLVLPPLLIISFTINQLIIFHN